MVWNQILVLQRQACFRTEIVLLEPLLYVAPLVRMSVRADHGVHHDIIAYDTEKTVWEGQARLGVRTTARSLQRRAHGSVMRSQVMGCLATLHDGGDAVHESGMEWNRVG